MTHLSIEDRQKIEESLKENLSFTNIGELIGKDRTCVSKEIRNHLQTINRSECGGNVHCANFKNCTGYKGKFCKVKCEDYTETTCEKLKKPPYTCNGCDKKRYCNYEKKYYRYLEADKEYKKELTDSRSGIRISADEVKKINKLIAPLILEQKHSVHQVYVNNPDVLCFSESSFYNYTDLGVFDIKNIDLPRRVRYKKGSTIKRTRKESLIRVNRTYKDYNEYLKLNANRDISIVQMDTVEGIKGGKVFLTLLFENYNLMLTYLLDQKNVYCVNEIFDKIKLSLGEVEFKRLFEVILTDNGSEFFGADNIECNKDGEKLVSLFYCDPSASYQKGALEKNHEYLRYYLPKPSTFDDLNQMQVSIMNNHINSVPRKSLRNMTPYNLSSQLLTNENKTQLGLKFIAPNDVSLSIDIIKKS